MDQVPNSPHRPPFVDQRDLLKPPRHNRLSRGLRRPIPEYCLPSVTGHREEGGGVEDSASSTPLADAPLQR